MFQLKHADYRRVFAGFVTQETWYQPFRRRAIYHKLKKGPVFEEAIECAIPRKPLVDEIRRQITPTETSSAYSVIIGEHGTGKTSLIKLAVDGMDEPKGVMYVDIPKKCDSEVDVVKAMQTTLGWSLDRVIYSGKSASLGEVLEDLSYFAREYRQEYRKIPVLIIDNTNRLAQKHQDLLHHFLGYAKHTTDKEIISIVFVSSEGHRVLRHMMGNRDSWPRCGNIIDIGDVSKEEALQYLKLRKIDEERAAQIYELVGGRMKQLKDAADEIKRNGTHEAMRKTMFSNTKSQLNSAAILPGHRYHKDGAKIVRELLKKGSISRVTFGGLVDRNTGDKLLEANIFAYRFRGGEITFQSTVMKRVSSSEPESMPSAVVKVQRPIQP